MTEPYDLVAIGTGTAATVAASHCRSAGWRVAVVDHLPFGGTCALRGCDPKKVLVAASETIDSARRMQDKGVDFERLALDWPALMRFKRSFTEPTPGMMEHSFARKGIDAFHGRARLDGPHSVVVGDERLEGHHILLAVGAVPATLGIDGEAHLLTSTDFLELPSLPRRILLVGGGYIAAEFSHIAARADAHVTILQRGARLLPGFDATLVDWLTERSLALGIDVQPNAEVRSVRKVANGFIVEALVEGQPRAFKADIVVHAAGRVPDLATLGLKEAGVETKTGRLVLNEFLQSVSNPAVYAAGDAASMGPPLTPVAAHDAKVVAENMLHGNHQKPNYSGVPTVAFTTPPLASVGLTEKEAQGRGLDFHVNVAKASDWYTPRRVNEPTYGYKTIIENGTDRVLGASLIGPHVDEVINLFALAVRHGLTATQLKDTMFAYPTGASDIGYMLG